MNCKKIAGWLAAAALAGAIALYVGFLGAGYFLEAPAQPPAKADLLVSLGGDNGARIDRVLELYRKGLAQKILITGPDGGYSKTRASLRDWRARYLMEEGVPEKALLYDTRARNSREEAANALQLMQAMKLDRVLVVSDPPHLRRLSLVWGRAFTGSGKTYTLVASDMEDWDAEHWWRLSANAQFVFAEYIKLAYYLVQY